MPISYGYLISQLASGHDASLSFGYGGSYPGPVLTFTDLDGKPKHWYFDYDIIEEVEIYDPMADIELENCLWGEEILFCKAKVEIWGMQVDAIVSHDYTAGVTNRLPFLASGAIGPNALKGAYKNFVVIELNNNEIHVLTPVVGGFFQDTTVAVGAAESRSPVIGRAGGYYPTNTRYVVFQEENPNGSWTLNAWDIDKGAIVSSQNAGFERPNPSQLHGVVWIEGGFPVTIREWDPSEPYSGDPEGDPGEPSDIVGTPLKPSDFDCTYLKEISVGPAFAIMKGEHCLNGTGTNLVAVVRADHSFVVGWDSVLFDYIYQPFQVADLPSSENYSNFLAYEDLISFVDDDYKLRVLKVDHSRVTPSWVWRSSYANINGDQAVALAPWNVGSVGIGEVNFRDGTPYHRWMVHLAGGLTYRLFALSANDSNCNLWYDDTRIAAERFDLYPISVVADNNQTGDSSIAAKCGGIEITPPDDGDYWITIDRATPGAFPNPPPMPYELRVVVVP